MTLEPDSEAARFRRLRWRGAILITGLAILSFGIAGVPGSESPASQRSTNTPRPAPERVIVLSPSCLDALLMIGAGPKVVGVSRFCKPNPDVIDAKVVGGYLDIDFETTLATRPDCVILLEAQRDLAPPLARLGIRPIMVDHSSVSGILRSIDALGNLLEKKAEAAKILGVMQNQLGNLAKRPPMAAAAPRVMVCLDRDTAAGRPERVVIAGRGSIHGEFINLCGARNAYEGDVEFPMVSRENLLRMDPDIIIDLVMEADWVRLGDESMKRQWAAFPELRAVRSGRIALLHDSTHMIPGPRFPETLATFDSIIHNPP